MFIYIYIHKCNIMYEIGKWSFPKSYDVKNSTGTLRYILIERDRETEKDSWNVLMNSALYSVVNNFSRVFL